MIAVNELRGIISSRGLSQRRLANMMGITEKTFYDKMKKGVFNSNEIQAMIDILHIDNPAGIFFTAKVS